MTVAQALKDGAARLEQAGASDARVNAGWILSSLTGQARLALPLCGSELDARTLARYESLLTRLAAGEPLQYVLGEQEFMGCRFAEMCIRDRLYIAHALDENLTLLLASDVSPVYTFRTRLGAWAAGLCAAGAALCALLAMLLSGVLMRPVTALSRAARSRCV